MANIPATYTVLRNKALPGQIADTQLRNVRGATVSTTEIIVGRFAFLDSAVAPTIEDGHYIPVKATGSVAEDIPIGVAIISHSDAPKFVYAERTPTNLLDEGTVWVEVPLATTLADVVKGKKFAIKPDGSISITADEAGSWGNGHEFSGDLVAHKLDATKKLAKIQLTKVAQYALNA